MVKEQSFDSQYSTYSYDPAGQLHTVQEWGEVHSEHSLSQPESAAARIETRFERDPMGRLLTKRVKSHAHSSTQTTQFRYDLAGQLCIASNAHSKIELTYDIAGQLTQETLHAAQWEIADNYSHSRSRPPLKRQARSHSLHHDYDTLGNRIAATLPDGRVLNTLSYGSGHVHQINLDSDIISDFKRDALHRSRAHTQGGLRQQTRYDRAASPGGEERFAFDPAHNLLPAQGEASVANNRLSVYQDLRFEHDRHGRVVHKKSGKHTEMTLAWDAEHQLSSATTIRKTQASANTSANISASTRQTTHYSYDPFGRRLSKQGDFATTWFVWDGNRLLQEHTPQHNRTYIYQPSSFVPLAQVDQHTGQPSAVQTAKAQNSSTNAEEHSNLPSFPATGDDIIHTPCWCVEKKID